MKTYAAAKREVEARNNGTQKLTDGRVWAVTEKRGNWAVVAIWPR